MLCSFGKLQGQTQEHDQVFVFVLQGEMALMNATKLLGERKGQTRNKDGVGPFFKGFEQALKFRVFEGWMRVFKAHLDRRRGGWVALKDELDMSLGGALIDGVADDQGKQRGDDIFVAFQINERQIVEFPPPSDGFVFELGAKRPLALFEQSRQRKRRDLGLDLSEQTTVVV